MPSEDSPSKKLFKIINYKILNLFSFAKKIFKLKKSANIDNDYYLTLKKLNNSSRFMSNNEKKIINNFLKFSKKTVNDILIPRINIRGITKDSNLDELNSFIMKYRHTRTIIYDDNLDNIIGFIHIKDLYNIVIKKEAFVFDKLIRKHILVPTFMKLIDLLAEMQRQRIHMAVVIDEYGGTEGIATIEDLVEEIVGEIEDEFDSDKFDDNRENFTIIDSQNILMSSRVKVETIEHLTRQNLKSEDDAFDTIGGLILNKIGHMPIKGTIVAISDSINAEIINATPRTLKQIKLILSEGVTNVKINSKLS